MQKRTASIGTCGTPLVLAAAVLAFILWIRAVLVVIMIFSTFWRLQSSNSSRTSRSILMGISYELSVCEALCPLPARNHATPPARTTTAIVSMPESWLVVAVAAAVVVRVIRCLRLAYLVTVSSSYVPVAICPLTVVVTSEVVKPFAPSPPHDEQCRISSLDISGQPIRIFCAGARFCLSSMSSMSPNKRWSLLGKFVGNARDPG